MAGAASEETRAVWQRPQRARLDKVSPWPVRGAPENAGRWTAKAALNAEGCWRRDLRSAGRLLYGVPAHSRQPTALRPASSMPCPPSPTAAPTRLACNCIVARPMDVRGWGGHKEDPLPGEILSLARREKGPSQSRAATPISLPMFAITSMAGPCPPTGASLSSSPPD